MTTHYEYVTLDGTHLFLDPAELPTRLRLSPWMQRELSGLKGMGCGSGYCLTIGGWFIFAYSILAMVVGPSDRERATFSDHLVHVFRVSGWWIVPGWLSLRFAAGLFPFSRRLFRWQKEWERV